MRTVLQLLLLLGILGLAVLFCTLPMLLTPTVKETLQPTLDFAYLHLVASLRVEMGSPNAVVELPEMVQQPFLKVPGRLVRLLPGMVDANQGTVQIFEYANEKVCQEDAGRIAADESAIRNGVIEWIDQPNFWAKGRVLVLYVGKDEAILGLLNEVLGAPLTSYTVEIKYTPVAPVVITSTQEVVLTTEQPRFLTPLPGTTQRYTHPVFGVRFQYPLGWERLEDAAQPGERFGGPEGFFQVTVLDGGGLNGEIGNWTSLDEIAFSEAQQAFNPYGSMPVVEVLQIQGYEARLILPSSDQPPAMHGQAMLLVELPHPVQVDGAPYGIFVLYADSGHIGQMIATLSFEF